VETRIDKDVALRAGLVQLLLVGVLFAILAVTVSHGFFEDWGWLVGPLIWLGCALLTGRVLSLPADRVLMAGVLSGILSAIGVLVGIHSLGIVLAIVAFALLCGHIPRAASEAR
jgi:hypothetical protein